MSDAEFEIILEKFSKYLSEKKQFVENTFRTTEIKKGVDIARKLFPDAKICINGDPLETGSLYLHIEVIDIDVSGETEINLFADLITMSDNFEIYFSNDYIVFALLFQNAFIRI